VQATEITVRTAIVLLLPVAGLAIAIVFRRSYAARVGGVALALIAGTFSVAILVSAHRLAETHLEGRTPSVEWPRGIDTMRMTVNRPVPVLLVSFLVLAVIALMPGASHDRGGPPLPPRT
jgi:hypothetical protein